jgi:hypothetical protein
MFEENDASPVNDELCPTLWESNLRIELRDDNNITNSDIRINNDVFA